MTNDTQNQVRREMPGTINPWLRFQVGIAEKRPMFSAVYIGPKVTAHYATGTDVWTFSLKGWGETMEAAEKMAGIYTAKPKTIPNYDNDKD